MNPFDVYPPAQPWSPPAQGGFDPEKNYNVPSSQQKEKPSNAWQGNVHLVSSNTAIGPIKSLITPSFPEPGIYTAQFSITQPSRQPGGPPAATPLSVLRCQAILSWTVEGNQIQRIFDIGNGTTISGAGAGAIIQVQDLTVTLPSSSGTNGVEYLVSVSMTKGTRAQFAVPVIQPGAASKIGVVPQPVPNPIGTVSVPALSFAIFPVPQNAGVIGVKVFVTDLTTPASRPTFVSASQLDISGTITYNTWIPDLSEGFVPLTPGAQFVSVLNNHNADSAQVTVDWAIDG